MCPFLLEESLCRKVCAFLWIFGNRNQCQSMPPFPCTSFMHSNSVSMSILDSCPLTHACLSPFAFPALAGCNPKQQPGSAASPSSGPSSRANRKWRNSGRLHPQKHHSPAAAAAGQEGGGGGQRRPQRPSKFKLWREGPNFDTELPQDVLALSGRSAFLTCRVFDRQNRTVGRFNYPMSAPDSKTYDSLPVFEIPIHLFSFHRARPVPILFVFIPLSHLLQSCPKNVGSVA